MTFTFEGGASLDSVELVFAVSPLQENKKRVRTVSKLMIDSFMDIFFLVKEHLTKQVVLLKRCYHFLKNSQ